MYLLECTKELQPVMTLLGWVVTVIQWGIPIALIILGMVDLGKAVIASKDDEVKKAQKAFGRRVLYAVLVFLVVWVVTIIFGSVIPALFGNENSVSGTSNWEGCWNCVMTKGKETGNCIYTSLNQQ